MQVVEAADSITYDTHDADDALELGLLTLDELLTTALWAAAAERVRVARTAISTAGELRRAVLHELIDWQVGDLLARATAAAGRRRRSTAPQAARAAPPIVVASAELAEQKRELEAFLRDAGLSASRRARPSPRGPAACCGPCSPATSRRPELLPESFRRRVGAAGLERTVGDYLAGMTDRFARREYRAAFCTGRGPATSNRSVGDA